MLGNLIHASRTPYHFFRAHTGIMLYTVEMRRTWATRFMEINLSSAIEKLQRVKGIVVPRVDVKGFPLSSGNYFTFENEAIASYICLGVLHVKD